MRLLLPLLALLRAPAPEPAPPFELRWEAPSTCPDQAAVRAAVEQRLGRAIAAPLGDGLVIDVRAEPQADGRWRIVLDLQSPDGEAHRELGEATDCAAAVDAAALVIAIGIDPELATAIPEAPPTAEPKPRLPPSGTVSAVDGGDERAQTAASTNPDDTPTPSPAEFAPRSRTRAAIGTTAAVSVGDLPTVGGHGRGVIALLRPRARVEIGGSYGAAPSFVRNGVSLDLRRWTVDARACAVLVPLRWLEVLPCAGVEAGQELARPRRGVVDDRTHRYVWAAAIAAPTLAFVPRRWLALRLGLELRVPFAPRQYSVKDRAGHPLNVYRAAPVSGALVAGIELRFP